MDATTQEFNFRRGSPASAASRVGCEGAPGPGPWSAWGPRPHYTLVGALGAAGLDEPLSDEDAAFTGFAPTNSAFENTDADELTDNPELLSAVLEYHVVSG